MIKPPCERTTFSGHSFVKTRPAMEKLETSWKHHLGRDGHGGITALDFYAIIPVVSEAL